MNMENTTLDSKIFQQTKSRDSRIQKSKANAHPQSFTVEEMENADGRLDSFQVLKKQEKDLIGKPNISFTVINMQKYMNEPKSDVDLDD